MRTCRCAAVDLNLDGNPGDGYTSQSQWARRVTEDWASRNMYCVACPSPRVTAHRNNAKVEDFHCPECRRQLQLKAKRGRIGASVANSAYEAKMEAIRQNRAPDYAFLSYDRASMSVTGLFLVPGHFITPTVVSQRAPLRSSARRAGWVGSNILLNRIPPEGKIALVSEGRAVPRTAARAAFAATAFLQQLPAHERGWLGDVLSCLGTMGVQPGDPFTLEQVYSFEGRLRQLHPRNQNVRPKIRQQLQVLRDRGLVEFSSQGRYVKL